MSNSQYYIVGNNDVWMTQFKDTESGQYKSSNEAASVGCEPVSAPNSLLTGKLTGNLPISGVSAANLTTSLRACTRPDRAAWAACRRRRMAMHIRRRVTSRVPVTIDRAWLVGWAIPNRVTMNSRRRNSFAVWHVCRTALHGVG
jgi:hypothetical protein